MEIPIYFNHDWLSIMENKIKADGPWDKQEFFQLALEAAKSLLVPEFNSLACLAHLTHFTPYPHQIEAALKVITEMHGRAILADEVGLGKTIEAGLILKEYMVRGLVKKALILVPASLVLQWTKELNQKFSIPAVAQKKEYMWKQCDILVASLDTAKRPPNRDQVLEQEYDLVIVDEAHKLKNPKSKNYEFMLQVKKKYFLLLTATPIQNEIGELFHLVSLLRPGLLGESGTFADQFTQGKRRAKNNAQLQSLLKKVMIRTRRKDEGIALTKRHVYDFYLDLSPEEKSLYDGVTSFVKEYYRQEEGQMGGFSLITLQKEVCSSKEAAFFTLYNMFHKLPEHSLLKEKIGDLLEKIKAVRQHTKAKKMLELIQDINDKVIVFTAYRATQDYLQRVLHENGISSVPFRGGFGRNKKDWMTDLFQKQAQVLIATEAGGEGINLQFCNHIINYDLPWNPMRVEQRIGRVHRLGQTRDVHIYNLTTKGTVEAHILKLLYEKIDLFEMVIGELDDILARLNLTQTLEENLAEIIFQSESVREMEIKLENLSACIRSVKDNLQDHLTVEQKGG
jgi:SNF2 family DNA or RNA helicase